MCRSTEDLKEKLYNFTITDEEVDKMDFLKKLCRQIANNACRPDAVKIVKIILLIVTLNSNVEVRNNDYSLDII